MNAAFRLIAKWLIRKDGTERLDIAHQRRLGGFAPRAELAIKPSTACTGATNPESMAVDKFFNSSVNIKKRLYQRHF